MRSYSINANGTTISVNQAAIPDGLWKFDVTTDSYRSPAYITISNSQPGGAVTYTLFRDDAIIQSRTGTGQPIHFPGQTIGGKYTVEAQYGTKKETLGSFDILAPTEVIFERFNYANIPQPGGMNNAAFVLSRYSIMNPIEIASRVKDAFISNNSALSGKLLVNCTFYYPTLNPLSGYLSFVIDSPNLSPEDQVYTATFGGGIR